MASRAQVVVVNYGSQLTLVIGRILRELGVLSVILEPDQLSGYLKKIIPKAIILSGGNMSVYEVGAPHLPAELIASLKEDEPPFAVLGICYGMQLLAYDLSGEVKAVLGSKEYGRSNIRVKGKPCGIFAGTPEDQSVWTSHGDSVVRLPDGFSSLATSETGAFAAMSKGKVIGVQFHPEVEQTLYGGIMLKNFLSLAGCKSDLTQTSLIDSIRCNIVTQLDGHKAIAGYSGGVDSSVLATIATLELKDRFLAVTIDGGQLREGELEVIRDHANACGINLIVINAHQEFSEAMADVTDAEEKRHRFQGVYAACLIRAAKAFGAPFVLQGTLAPDQIESGTTGAASIKTHHNTGLDLGDLKQLHPIDFLFKYEVRELARQLGLPKSISQRQPSPGPGLFIRVVGTPATPDKLKIVRWADARVKEILVRHGIYDELSQVVVDYIGVDTVGVKGDARVYGGAIVVRAVLTNDFMTAHGVHFSDEVEDDISSQLTSHPKIVRVWYDPTDKPPATTELE